MFRDFINILHDKESKDNINFTNFIAVVLGYYLLKHQLLYLKDSGYSEEVFRNFLSKENVKRFLSGGVHGMLYAFLFEEIKEVVISSIRKNFLNYEKNIYNIAASHIGDYKGNSKFGNPNDEKFLENVTKIIIEQKH